MPQRTHIYDQFMANVDDSRGTHACHPWTGARNSQGYGSFRINNRTTIASRWLLGHIRGRPLDRDELACHHCDQPWCMNPCHLYIGNAATNGADRALRCHRRQPRPYLYFTPPNVMPIDQPHTPVCKACAAVPPPRRTTAEKLAELEGEWRALASFQRTQERLDDVNARRRKISATAEPITSNTEPCDYPHCISMSHSDEPDFHVVRLPNGYVMPVNFA